MLILKIALRNLFRHKKRTILLSSMILAGVALLFTANAIFERTKTGLESSFSGSLTGNLVIGALSDTTSSIFGSEMPLVSDYAPIDSIPLYEALESAVAEIPEIIAYTSVVSAPVRLEIDDFDGFVPSFGINPDTYFSVCPDVTILKGDFSSLEAGSGGVFLNSVLVKNIEEELGRPLEMGEPVQLSVYSTTGFRIRKGYFAGIHQYVNKVQPFDKIILADSFLIRDLINYSLGSTVQNTGTIEEEEVFSFDDLFAEAGTDLEADSTVQLTLDQVETALSQKTEIFVTDTDSWSFLLLKTADNRGTQVKNQVEDIIENQGWSLQLMNWKQAAGMSAQMAFALQYAFTVGIFFIIVGAILVVMNGLVISVLERKSEIGTMRAVGAGKSFISRLFITETFLLVSISTLLGIFCGIALCLALMGKGITLHNNLLITLFAGDRLLPVISAKSVFFHLAGSLCVAVLAWIYPVRIALKIQPVSIMGQGL